ncbi:MAG TPA: DUF881 domain-containing protein [Candidatus Limnocylindrales bacterium]
MRATRNSISVALVAVVLGLLLVVQFRAQSSGNALDALSATELTDLVANLNTRNDQLRTEITATRAQLDALVSAQARGDTSLGQLQADLSKIRAWAGLLPVTGPGIQVTIAGRIPGIAVQDLLNELRNAGAESYAVDGVRVVSGSVVAGPAGAISIEDTSLGDPFEVDAIGNAATLTGSLTRAGGIVARLKATFPDVQLTVTPVDRLELPATTRSLVPGHGQPRL